MTTKYDECGIGGWLPTLGRDKHGAETAMQEVEPIIVYVGQVRSL